MLPLSLPDRELSVVGLAAHPDDLEIGAGATLLSLGERHPGIRLSVLCLTGSGARRAEAQAAAAAFGGSGSSVEFAELPDGRLPEHWGAAKAFLHALAGRQPAPDLVFAPSPADAHQDHALVGSLAPTVWRDSLILGYEIPKWDGDLGRPSAYVSVAPEVARRKVELLTANFTSQIGRDWWDDEVFFGLMRLRGMECRSQYAEAFHISKLLVAASGQDSSAQDYGAVK